MVFPGNDGGSWIRRALRCNAHDPRETASTRIPLGKWISSCCRYVEVLESRDIAARRSQLPLPSATHAAARTGEEGLFQEGLGLLDPYRFTPDVQVRHAAPNLPMLLHLQASVSRLKHHDKTGKRASRVASTTCSPHSRRRQSEQAKRDPRMLCLNYACFACASPIPHLLGLALTYP
jgi:hypothetical protein